MKNKFRLSLQWKFLLVITVIVFPSLGGIFLWEGVQHEKQVKNQILSQATVLSRLVVLVRQWVSDCGGGLSVMLPVGNVLSATRTDHVKTAVLGLGLIFLMIFTFFILLKRLVIKPMRKFEEMAKEIGEGNLNTRVDIQTGDEFEKLAAAFNTMAERIETGRDHLEARINQATRELSEANRELQTLDKLKSDFLATMSHELRSPLTVIRGGVDYLDRTIKGEDNRKYLHIIDKNLARLMHLVSDIFDSTRIEADSADWSFETENLTGLVREVVEILEPPAAEKRITVDCGCSADIYVEMNLERIEQVLVNILENAIKFSRESGKIEIDVRENPESVRVSIKDNGRGISKEHLETVFEKFRTLPASQNRGRTEGAGLGLAICKGIIDAHGGLIRIPHSNAPFRSNPSATIFSRLTLPPPAHRMNAYQ